MIVVILLVFLLGLSIGSFLNVIVYRVLHGVSFAKGRSKCPHCKKKISWYDNLPLVSFLLLKGKCRHCHKKISWHYPVLELLTGVLFVWWYGVGQFFFQLSQEPFQLVQPIFWLVVGLLFLALAVADAFYGVLPDKFIVPLSLLAVAYRIALVSFGIMQLADFWKAITVGVATSGFLMSLVLITKGKGMGLGDVKLALPLGIILGWPRALVGLIVAFLTGAIAGVILILGRGRGLKDSIAFGPFMIAGAVIALLWGEQIWQKYMTILGI